MILSTKGQLSPFKKLRQMRWKLGGGEDQEHKGKCSEKGRPYESARDVVRKTCRQPPK